MFDKNGVRVRNFVFLPQILFKMGNLLVLISQYSYLTNHCQFFRKSNKNLNKVLESWGMPYDYKGLESFYIRKLQILLSEKSRKKQSIGNSISITNLSNILNHFFCHFFQFGKKYLIMVEHCIQKPSLKFGKDGEEVGNSNSMR